MSTRVLVALVLLGLSSTPALGQGAPPPPKAAPAAPAAPATTQPVNDRSQVILEMVKAGDAAAAAAVGSAPFATTFGAGREEHIVAYLIAFHSERPGYRALLDLMEARVDTQVGASSSSAGSTSLASKGLVPDILGFAVEHGAVNENISGTTVTFRATPAGIVSALQGQGLLDTYASYAANPALRFASGFSAAASFDTSLGSSSGTFTATSKQLTSWAVRWQAVNGRDPSRAEYASQWKTSAPKQAYDDATIAVNAKLSTVPEFATWEKNLAGRVAQEVDGPWATDKNTPAAASKFQAILSTEMPKLEKIAFPDVVTAALDTLVSQLTIVENSAASIYSFIGKGQLLTFDWTTTRDVVLPDLYTATGIYETGLGAMRNTDMTLNVGVSMFRHVPTGATHAFKSVDVTTEFDHPLGSGAPSATLSFAARYSYLPNDSVASTGAAMTGTTSTTASTVATSPKGSIVVVQFKVTVPVKGSGVKIPLSVTASNRTELIKEKDVRASLGITFDLGTLLTALAPKK